MHLRCARCMTSRSRCRTNGFATWVLISDSTGMELSVVNQFELILVVNIALNESNSQLWRVSSNPSEYHSRNW